MAEYVNVGRREFLRHAGKALFTAAGGVYLAGCEVGSIPNPKPDPKPTPNIESFLYSLEDIISGIPVTTEPASFTHEAFSAQPDMLQQANASGKYRFDFDNKNRIAQSGKGTLKASQPTNGVNTPYYKFTEEFPNMSAEGQTVTPERFMLMRLSDPLAQIGDFLTWYVQQAGAVEGGFETPYAQNLYTGEGTPNFSQGHRDIFVSQSMPAWENAPILGGSMVGSLFTPIAGPAPNPLPVGACLLEYVTNGPRVAISVTQGLDNNGKPVIKNIRYRINSAAPIGNAAADAVQRNTGIHELSHTWYPFEDSDPRHANNPGNASSTDPIFMPKIYEGTGIAMKKVLQQFPGFVRPWSF